MRRVRAERLRAERADWSSAGCSDFPENEASTIEITQEPTKGTATPISNGTPNPAVQYTAEELGADEFKFTVADDEQGIEYTVTTNNVPQAVNPPQCQGATGEDYEVGEPSIAGGCSDVDGDNVTITITQEPTNGTVQIQGNGSPFPSINCTATGTGPDTFSFDATDGENTSDEVVATTNNVPAVNDPPICGGPFDAEFEVGVAQTGGGCFDEEQRRPHDRRSPRRRARARWTIVNQGTTQAYLGVLQGHHAGRRTR